jgi:ubiquinone/menaquinone biosynthesis C-methylase UbiE
MNSLDFPVGTAAQAFDGLADQYDELFTNSLIGRLQRRIVWDALSKTFGPGDSVLELNCGTGEDALFLARCGVSVLACDVSSRMIEIAKEKTGQERAGARIRFEVLSNERLDSLQSVDQFDGAVSNFSGLNCVAHLRQVASQLSRLIKPHGRAVLCMSTRVCLWEILWYLCHGKPRKAFRRIPGFSVAQIRGTTISVFYPSKHAVRLAFAPWFLLRKTQAVGLFIPPSYVEEWAARHKGIVAVLDRLDRVFRGVRGLAHLGDHILLEFERAA